MRVAIGVSRSSRARASAPRQQQVAVRHVGKKRIAGEVAVADHDGTQRPGAAIEMPFHSGAEGSRTDDRGGCCLLDAGQSRRRACSRAAFAAGWTLRV